MIMREKISFVFQWMPFVTAFITAGIIVFIWFVNPADEFEPSVKKEHIDNTRQLIAEEVARAIPKTNPDNIDNYLESLIDRARQKNHADSLDVEPGIEVALFHKADPRKVDAFIRHMQAINGIKTSQPPIEKYLEPHEIKARLAKLSSSIRVAVVGSENLDHMLNQYIQLAHQLRPDAMADALMQLDRIIPRSSNAQHTLQSGSYRPPPTPGSREHLKASITQNERSKLIDQHFHMNQHLSPSDRETALIKLNQYTR